MSQSLPSPRQIAAELERRVFGQPAAVREVSIALAKKLAGLDSGNVLLIGSSGTGKTTLMRAVEAFLEEHESLRDRATLVRVHANILAQEAALGDPGERLLRRLLERARRALGPGADRDAVLGRLRHGIVFVDEIDKIRGHVGEEPNVAGIRAQEALLTVMENERLPVDLGAELGGRVELDTRGILFVGAGAFEGLYDAVYDRVTVGENRGALQPVTVLGESQVREETRFSLRDWLSSRDLFAYGMTPQFLSRFDATVVLEDLGPDELLKIFLSSSDSPLGRARKFFAALGAELVLSPEAARAVAEAAAREPRLGARALKDVFGRVLRRYEFEPDRFAVNGAVVIDRPDVEAALGA